ncbi:helix-turn-helix transcriptional regulator [Geopsychrobacter electrodiphilus]|uniref:helix-turn-helix transcriptional regulator n=1 Tax=Geopsychrobacter electrodiphilus TaxID=225196 RepID=UPI00037DBD74|nr:helix-turn-helix transcriptional regulator [Geopsychrobacter electrodiphilus]
MKTFSSPSVSIDGEAIRRIREDGKLTQFYVAKVVGVTTDTVSRWENNRYPTMRRDNALKLAEALEVDLEAILKTENSEPLEFTQEEIVLPKKSHLNRYVAGAILLVGILIVAVVLNHRISVPPNLLSGHRHIPNYTAPGARVPIHLEISSKKKLKGLIIREEFPPGWNLVEADPPPASVDNLNGNVRWMIRSPAQVIKVVYILQPPLKIAFNSEIRLSGVVVANPEGQGFSYAIPSKGSLKIAPLHWADTNGNSVIDDLEILDVNDMVDASNQIHYDWDLIEEMWDAGGYKYDKKKHVFVPVKVTPHAIAK